MKRRRIALHGNYYDFNFGDLLLFKVFERWVRAALDCDVVYPWVPEAERERFQGDFPGVEVTSDGGGQWDALIYCGGGLFADAGTDGRWLPGYFARRFFREYVWPGERCIWSGTPYAIIGPGAGPLTNILARFEAGRLFRHAALVSVRDQESVRFLRDRLRVRGTIRCAPDPAVTVSREDLPAKAVQAIEALVAPLGERPLLGVHHPRDYLPDTPHASAMRHALITALREREDVVPVLFSDIGAERSVAQLEELAAVLRAQAGRDAVVVPFAGTWQTAALIGRMNAMLTTKLHVGIVSYALGVYVESFALHPKTLRFYQATGRAEQAQLYASIDADAARAKIRRAMDRAAERRVLTGEMWRDTRARAEQHGGWVADFLAGALGSGRNAERVLAEATTF